MAKSNHRQTVAAMHLRDLFGREFGATRADSFGGVFESGVHPRMLGLDHLGVEHLDEAS